MGVLVFVDKVEGKVKKASYEAIHYGSKIGEVTAVVLGDSNDDLSILGNYGAAKVLHLNNEKFNQFDASSYSAALAELFTSTNSSDVVLSYNQNGKTIASRLSAKLKAGLIPGAVDLPEEDGSIKKSVYSGKAIAYYKVKSSSRVIAVQPNSIPVVKSDDTAQVEQTTVGVTEAAVKTINVEKQKGEIPLSEAELVVSGGRGLRGPENWDMIEDLANELNAATACSRAVADVGWRPHHEHVGQTGLAINPNLYFAIAISGAIQHLAGVNNSKTIVVVNTDPEAPFFKAADYGIVGDAFEVIPKFTEALRKFKSSSN